MLAACLRSLCAALLMLQGALAWTAEVAYPAVVPGIGLVFSDDTRAPPEFRTEWWCLTGWPEQGNCRPQLAAERQLCVCQATQRLRGRAGPDHERSSELMPPGARDRDWMAQPCMTAAS